MNEKTNKSEGLISNILKDGYHRQRERKIFYKAKHRSKERIKKIPFSFWEKLNSAEGGRQE